MRGDGTFTALPICGDAPRRSEWSAWKFSLRSYYIMYGKRCDGGRFKVFLPSILLYIFFCAKPKQEQQYYTEKPPNKTVYSGVYQTADARSNAEIATKTNVLLRLHICGCSIGEYCHGDVRSTERNQIFECGTIRKVYVWFPLLNY